MSIDSVRETFFQKYIASNSVWHFLQKQLLFRPVPLDPGYQFRFGEPFEELFFEAKDGARINALFFKTPRHSKGVVLYFHGNSGNLQRWGNFHHDFTSRGYDFLVIDYRGYGKSSGEIREAALYTDARMAYDWLLPRYKTEDIILYGRSLGTGIASQLASTVDCRMLILETPYDSIEGMIRTRFPLLRFPFITSFRFRNDEHILKVACPVHIFHGTDDEIVPYASALRLKPLLRAEHHFITIPGGMHKNLGKFEAFQEELGRILQ